jgi:hypothetical protein
MNMELQKGLSPAEIEWKSWGVAFCGEAIDDRGRAAAQAVQERAAKVVELRYDSENFEVSIEGSRIEVGHFPDALRPFLAGPVVLEATTLGFVEILLCCRALHGIGIQGFDLVYVEPDRYRIPRRQNLLHRRDFELSMDVPGYRAIPGHAILLGDRTQQKGVFFLGYEEERLRRAFEDLQMIRPAAAAIAFGVPAFKPGWEMDAFANNIGVVREHNIRGGVYFCGAENPEAAVDMLLSIYKGLGPGERLFIAPIGTKPHGIGAALFVSQHNDVGIIYDHPRRTRNRSNAIAGPVNLFVSGWQGNVICHPSACGPRTGWRSG